MLKKGYLLGKLYFRQLSQGASSDLNIMMYHNLTVVEFSLSPASATFLLLGCRIFVWAIRHWRSNPVTITFVEDEGEEEKYVRANLHR